MNYFVGALIALLAIPSVSSAAVLFNEIAWMGTPESQFGEWIELVNDSDVEVDLSGAVLYEAGGNTPIITLTKKIAPRGLYLIERTTASVPDPLPGVGDDAGAFGGGGLSNTGEFLVLKDRAGSVLDSLDNSAGWIAGDAATKQTMQRTGVAWHTASATPRAANVVPATASSGATTSSSTIAFAPSSHAGSAVISRDIEEVDLVVSAGRERLATVGTELFFDAKARGIDSSVVDFEWSFGDGSFARGARAGISYQYPGEYVVVVNATHKGVSAVARTKVLVVPLDVVVLSYPHDSRVSLENRSSYELNLGGWQIAGAGQLFRIPRDTIVLPHKTTTFPAKITRLALHASSTVGLVRPDGVVVGSPAYTASVDPSDEIIRLRAMLVEASARIESLSRAFAEHGSL